MVEFGARLSLRDNMASTLQKNIKMQRQFSEQVKRTTNAVKSYAKQKASPILKIKDKASAVLSKVKGALKTIGSTTAKAFVAVKDGASAVLSKMGSMLKTLAKGATIAIGVAGAGAGLLLKGSLGEGANLQQSIGGVETLFKGDAGAVIANADKAFKTAGLSANAYMETVTSFSASLLQSLGGDTAKSAQIADMAIVDMADNANKFGTDMQSIQNAYQGFAKQNYTMLDNLKLGYGGTKEEMERLLKDAQKLTGVTYDISNLSDVYNAIHAVQENLGVAGATAQEASSTFTGSFNAMKASITNLFGNMALGGDITASMSDVVESASTFLFGNAIPMIGNVFSALPSAIKTGISKALPKIKESGGEIVKGLKDGIVALLPASMGEAFGSAFDGITNIISAVAPVLGELGGMFSRVSALWYSTLGDVLGNSGGVVNSFVGMISSSIPKVEGILGTLVEAFSYVAPVLGTLGSAFAEVFPDILGAVASVVPLVTPIIQTLGTVIQTVIPVVKNIITLFSQTIQQVMPIVSQVFTSVASAVMPVVQAIASAIQMALPVVQMVITTVVSAVSAVLPQLSAIFTEVGAKVAQVITTVVVPVINTLSGIFQKLAPVVSEIIGVVVSVLSGAWDVISPILDLAMTTFELVWSVLDPVLSAIADAIVWVWDIIGPVIDKIASGLSMVGDAIGGVADFVGKGLDTIGSWFGFAYGKDRVPYDNYPAMLHQGERVLTRNQADQYDRLTSTRGMGSSSGIPKASASSTSSGGGTSVTIEKLADTVVIEKEADVDKVVEGMISKFKKLVPNMA